MGHYSEEWEECAFCKTNSNKCDVYDKLFVSTPVCEKCTAKIIEIIEENKRRDTIDIRNMHIESINNLFHDWNINSKLTYKDMSTIIELLNEVKNRDDYKSITTVDEYYGLNIKSYRKKRF
ncbi:TPA: hypothetical protein KRE09_002281 [Clostridioides difficile]|uniref:Uncharacterized protein n=1 Tax=Clostridioides difficile TaxID=1496 RepID=A0A9X8RLG7_CLODI|nr:hypothetical protein [Clostridioides difficile]AUO78321.1 hypothetical protein LIBA6276_00103 [Clostridioides phage LIBA6276]AUO78492.1 hypothetical protein LIBA2945_00102 [Clostridioides phage LIBA2945]MDC0804368.1 hypothetical protein [Clostridium paraputrificum]AWH83383.1 hypothetical protein DDG63_20315 [Clostridioides difficile]EGT4145723.1 hypothetical protein [Clostridioides difficile]